MEIRRRIAGAVVVDNDVDTFLQARQASNELIVKFDRTHHINASPKDVGRHQDALLKVLELLVALDAVVLRQTGVDGDTGEAALSQ
jgi:hypothetical protein